MDDDYDPEHQLNIGNNREQEAVMAEYGGLDGGAVTWPQSGSSETPSR